MDDRRDSMNYDEAGIQIFYGLRSISLRNKIIFLIDQHRQVGVLIMFQSKQLPPQKGPDVRISVEIMSHVHFLHSLLHFPSHLRTTSLSWKDNSKVEPLYLYSPLGPDKAMMLLDNFFMWTARSSHKARLQGLITICPESWGIPRASSENQRESAEHHPICLWRHVVHHQVSLMALFINHLGHLIRIENLYPNRHVRIITNNIF